MGGYWRVRGGLGEGKRGCFVWLVELGFVWEGRKEEKG